MNVNYWHNEALKNTSDKFFFFFYYYFPSNKNILCAFIFFFFSLSRVRLFIYLFFVIACVFGRDYAIENRSGKKLSWEVISAQKKLHRVTSSKQYSPTIFFLVISFFFYYQIISISFTDNEEKFLSLKTCYLLSFLPGQSVKKKKKFLMIDRLLPPNKEKYTKKISQIKIIILIREKINQIFKKKLKV